MWLLSKEAMKAINNEQPPEAKYGDVFEAIAKAQLKRVVEKLKEYGEMQHEYCGSSCAHRGMEIFMYIYDWQDLLKEIGEEDGS